MGKKVTMDDIAERAGVSKSTVSYILSGKKKISDPVRRKVLEVVDELGYRPQQIAPELFSDSTNQIIVYYDNFSFSHDLAVLQHEIIRGIIDYLSNSKYIISIVTPATKLSSTDIESFEGVIYITPEITDKSIEKQFEHLPVVYIGTPEKVGTIFSVDVDGVGAGFQAATWLFEKMVKKLLFLKQNDWPYWYEQYEQGFMLACKENGLNWNDQISQFIDNADDLFAALDEYGKDIGAVVVPSEFYVALLENHPKCKELFVISMKHFSENSQNGNMGTVFPAYTLGVEAAKMLQNIISKQRVIHNSIIIACEFNQG